MRFIRAPWPIYADDPHWVPPLLLERRQHLDLAKNPFFAHAEAQLWLALRGERVVGRISAQIDRNYLQRHHDATGHFGFLEAEDDPQVFEGLLSTAESWLATRGMRRIAGPFSFSINHESGLLIDGFSDPPYLLMGHARPYYRPRVEALGYGKAQDLIAYRFDMTRDPLTPTAHSLIDRLLSRPEVTLRGLRRRQFRQDLDSVLDIFNDAWTDNWGFVPMEDAEISRMVKDLKPLLRDDLVCIAELGGEPVAFGLGLPNLNEAIADLDGALFPFGWAKLLFRLKAGRLRSVRLPLMGVRKAHQGTPLGAALAFAVIHRLYEAHRAHGFTEAELSWILEENRSMRRIIETAHGQPYKTYRIFEKDLT